ncbi:unnamed protein product [Chrysoparadoxa australica]
MILQALPDFSIQLVGHKNKTRWAFRTETQDEAELLRVEEKRGRGRSLMMNVAVPEGQQVMKAEAAGAVVRDKAYERACHRCCRGVREGLAIRCDGCKAAYYCTRRCLSEHASAQHQYLCQPLELLHQRKQGDGKTQDLEAVRLVMDLLARWACFPDCAPKQRQLVESLTAHEEGRQVQVLQEALLHSQALHGLLHPDLLGQVCQGQDQPGSQSIKRLALLLMRIRYNSYPVDTTGGVMVPQAVLSLFPEAAMLNHSCQPNVATHSAVCNSGGGSGIKICLVVRSCSPLAAGEELCMSYLQDLVKSRVERQQILKQAFHFDCQCVRCQKEKGAEELPSDGAGSTLLAELAETGGAAATLSKALAWLHAVMKLHSQDQGCSKYLSPEAHDVAMAILNSMADDIEAKRFAMRVARLCWEARGLGLLPQCIALIMGEASLSRDGELARKGATAAVLALGPHHQVLTACLTWQC